jgi:26S proteasome regulatory subunit N6
MEAKLTAAAELAETNPAAAAAQFEALIVSAEASEDAVKVKESAIYQLGEVYAKQGEAAKLGALLTNLRPFFATIPKAKTAKIVRTLIDQVAKIKDSLPLQMTLCRESIEWCKAEKRSFLRQRIQSRLAAMLLESKQYTEALALLAELLTEVKRLDDKPLLVEIFLVRSPRRCLGVPGGGQGPGP